MKSEPLANKSDTDRAEALAPSPLDSTYGLRAARMTARARFIG